MIKRFCPLLRWCGGGGGGGRSLTVGLGVVAGTLETVPLLDVCVDTDEAGRMGVGVVLPDDEGRIADNGRADPFGWMLFATPSARGFIGVEAAAAAATGEVAVNNPAS